jgi:hypothetical protein
MATTKKNNSRDNGGVILVGFVVLGTGIGLATGNMFAGSMIGVGAGFIAKAFL